MLKAWLCGHMQLFFCVDDDAKTNSMGVWFGWLHDQEFRSIGTFQPFAVHCRW